MMLVRLSSGSEQEKFYPNDPYYELTGSAVGQLYPATAKLSRFHLKSLLRGMLPYFISLK